MLARLSARERNMTMYSHLQDRARTEKPVTLDSLRRMKAEGEKIACLTAYDASFASAVDAAGTDLILVGDSLGMVIQGHDTTVPVTVDDMVYHTRCVRRGVARGFLVADMPFGSYSLPEPAFANAVRLMQEGGAAMVKLEGGALQVRTVEFLASRDIPVCAHIGLTPQSIHKLGGFKVQGRDQRTAQQMLADAHSLQEAGADIVLLECVPSSLGEAIAASLSVPVIGIGAGPGVDGQILVLYDILSVTSGRKPRFARDFLSGANGILDAFSAYVAAVKDGSYPAAEHCFS
jgi:3-methyl-2-oxobutanoate hydroxymethyltransferase